MVGAQDERSLTLKDLVEDSAPAVMAQMEKNLMVVMMMQHPSAVGQDCIFNVAFDT